MVRLTLCRGCCCGTTKARPDDDHVAQLARVAALARDHGATLRRSECLGPCEEANVVVVQPSPAARALGARPVWLGRVGDDQLEALGGWGEAGGPGHDPVPELLLPHVIPSRRQRAS